ncbi:MAG: hypothetical protein DRN60_03560 [Thaumarchaeota archaeon]|nr:MAG: hypothetical protein DRN60_03560 [Nitrososphaerota archaeon]
MERKTRLRIYLMLVEYTSIPIAIGLYLMFLSGYGLVTVKASILTLGFMDRARSILIHTTTHLKYFIGVLVALHALGGFGMMILRRVRDELVSKILESISLILIMAFMIQITILEFIPF